MAANFLKIAWHAMWEGSQWYVGEHSVVFAFLKWNLVLTVSNEDGFCTSCGHVVMSIFAHKTNLKNKCFGNVSVALDLRIFAIVV